MVEKPLSEGVPDGQTLQGALGTLETVLTRC